MSPNSAQLLLLIAASMGLAMPACVLPPYLGSEDSLGPHSPQVDREMLVPKAPKTQLHTACTNALQLRAERIIDLDTDLLNFRWVANNGVENTQFLDGTDSSRPPGMAHGPQKTFKREDLGFGSDLTHFTSVVSLFITDAPAEAWVVDPNTVIPGDPSDLGTINNPNNQFSVIEVRWTFEYDVNFTDQCTLPD